MSWKIFKWRSLEEWNGKEFEKRRQVLEKEVTLSASDLCRLTEGCTQFSKVAPDCSCYDFTASTVRELLAVCFSYPPLNYTPDYDPSQCGIFLPPKNVLC